MTMSNPQTSPIRLLIVDDHVFFRRGLRQVCEIEGGFKVVGEAADGREAVNLVQQLQPDVVLLDINMPVLDGIQATQLITADYPTTRVIVLTIERQDQYVFKAIKAGACGYLIKDVDETTLINAIRAVQRGESLIDPYLATQVMAEFRRLSQIVAENEAVEQLTPGEFDVLRLVAEGLNNQAIATRLIISERTVTNRLSQIYQKLHLNNRTEAALYALRQGWANLHPDTPAE